MVEACDKTHAASSAPRATQLNPAEAREAGHARPRQTCSTARAKLAGNGHGHSMPITTRSLATQQFSFWSGGTAFQRHGRTRMGDLLSRVICPGALLFLSWVGMVECCDLSFVSHPGRPLWLRPAGLQTRIR